jgi:3-oxoacyl-[acyl-carrier protein] reductase
MQKILAGKQAIITGASQGLGLEIARKFVGAGADVMLCARNEALLGDAYTELKGLWLENNGLKFISGLEKQTKLCSL